MSTVFEEVTPLGVGAKPGAAVAPDGTGQEVSIPEIIV